MLTDDLWMCHLQQHAAEEPLKEEHDDATGDAKPERQLGIEGWRAALAAWLRRATALLDSHNAKARPHAFKK